MTRLVLALSIACLGLTSCATRKQLTEIPYGYPVPGRPGFVLSPYEPYAGYVDTRGMHPGETVDDPYSNHVFLVPPVPPDNELLPVARGYAPPDRKKSPFAWFWNYPRTYKFHEPWGYMVPVVRTESGEYTTGQPGGVPVK